jgi:hypothetical protein
VHGHEYHGHGRSTKMKGYVEGLDVLLEHCTAYMDLVMRETERTEPPSLTREPAPKLSYPGYTAGCSEGTHSRTRVWDGARIHTTQEMRPCS